jgi:hypothetical protein
MDEITTSTHEAFKGGLFYLEHPLTTTLTDFCDTNTCNLVGITYDDNGGGGVFYINDDVGTWGAAATPTFTITDWNVHQAKTEGNGGFMYVDLPGLDMTTSNMVFTELISENSGGGYYAVDWKDIDMSDITVT